jgi:hypothetical protein
LHTLEVRDRRGNVSQAVLELIYQRIVIHPPVGKRRRYSALELTVSHAKERTV